MRNMIPGIVLILLSLAAIFWLIPTGVENPGPTGNIALSPAFWPYAVALMTLSFSVILTAQGVFQAIRNTGTRPRGANPQTQEGAAISRATDSSTDETAKTIIRWRMLIAVVLLLPYYYLCVYLGLPLASIIALAAYSVLAGERSYRTIACWAILGPLVLTLFFTKVAQVLIPLGPLKAFF